MTSRFSLLLAALTAFLAAAPAMAQVTPKPFTITAYALDSTTLSGGGMTVSLWGVAPLEAGRQAIRTRAALDDIIAGAPVRCTPVRQLSPNTINARCLTGQEQDIALALIGQGLAVTERRDLAGSDLASAYLDAERQARAAKLGLWADEQPSVAPDAPSDGPVAPWIIEATSLGVLLAGFLTLAFVLRSGFRQLVMLQKYQLAGTQKREKLLKAREKYVIASALEGEINANRAKLDAFMVIYEELLKSLRDPSKKPKYQRAGDIIHERPVLARTVYDGHIDKIELLGTQIAADLAGLYEHVSNTPDYRTLEPEIPVEKAREIVDRILRNAMKLSEPMDKALSALGVIVRDKQGPGPR